MTRPIQHKKGKKGLFLQFCVSLQLIERVQRDLNVSQDEETV